MISESASGESGVKTIRFPSSSEQELFQSWWSVITLSILLHMALLKPFLAPKYFILLLSTNIWRIDEIKGEDLQTYCRKFISLAR